MIGAVFRFQPLHNVHAAILRAMAERDDDLVVGVGSAQARDARNPWSADERVRMIRALLPGHPSLRIEPLVDLYDGPRWRLQALERLGPLDRLVSANGYVRKLLGGDYRLVHPLELIAPSPVSGSRVRLAMARAQPWERDVPREVADLLRREGLVERFVRDFGADVLAHHSTNSTLALNEENDHVRVG